MSALFKKYKEACLSGDATHASHVKPSTDTIKYLLVSAGYVVDLTGHQFVSDVGGGNIVARSPALTSVTITNGILNADSPTVSSVTGSTITQVILYKDTGTDATSPLMQWVNAATGLPDAPNGSAIEVTIDTGTHKIFEL